MRIKERKKRRERRPIPPMRREGGCHGWGGVGEQVREVTAHFQNGHEINLKLGQLITTRKY
jgi:hypothetical protein